MNRAFDKTRKGKQINMPLFHLIPILGRNERASERGNEIKPSHLQIQKTFRGERVREKTAVAAVTTSP